VNRFVLAALAPALIGTAAIAQTPDPHAGHAMPAKPAQSADPHAGHAMPATPRAAPAITGAQLAVGDAPAPRPPTDHLADAVYGRTSMDRARDVLRLEHGGARLPKTMIDMLEVRPDKGPDGYAWEGEFRYGGDVNRLVLRSEGEGSFGEHLEQAEVQALYSRAIGPYFDLQAGVRQDFQPRPRRTYATIGFEGLAPYWFEVEGVLFLSNKGDVSARFEGSYDLRFTQRLILEPRVEVNLAAQNVPELGVGAGLSDAELGLRLRYEIRREFAPYVGVHYERKFGDTADFARAAGEGRDDLRVVAGVRAWF
jgi:copper resistance protein B